MKRLAAALLILVIAPCGFARGQDRGRGAAPAGPAPTAKQRAPIDLTGYWVSLVVDEWRFRVTPQKGDIAYLPLTRQARDIANAWDPDKDKADGNACRAYGAIGVMQRPGRLHIIWDGDNALKIDTDAGTQTRLLHFGAPPAQLGAPTWQGYSQAIWQVNGRLLIDTGGTGFVPINRVQGATRGGQLKVTTTNMKPGYIRKNGVPYSGKAVLTEYFSLLSGQQNDSYIALTAMVDDPTYLTGQFIRTYTFKKAADASGWDPTPCWPR
ncbi:MAG TPA: hypothetical protein VG871_19475 [Vicinamibacterales bacterium]|nr:hypothetical protein [Vicinamibacterales bacterium]